MINFCITVIIPVFNKIQYVEQSIMSAIDQQFVGEVLAVDDGSSDGSYETLLKLEKYNLKLRVLTHEKRDNRGVSASRNLGIMHANSDFIAFLDADDYYLKDRFVKTFALFNSHKDADGIYECVGTSIENQINSSIMLKEKIAPDKLFESLLLEGHLGWFSPDGLTLRKTIFNKTGLFNSNLKVAEDTEMWFRITALFKLYPGHLLEPVTIARRNVAGSLTMKNNYTKENSKMWFELFKWSLWQPIMKSRKQLIIERLLEDKWNNSFFNHRILKKAYKLIYLFFLILNYPKITNILISK